MANVLAGTASFTADGENYQLAADAKYAVSSFKVESKTGMDGFHGVKRTPIPGSISMTVRDAGNLSVATFNSMLNTTVMLELANGKIIVGRNMACVDSQEVDASEGTFDVKFEGPSVTEQLAS